MENSFRSLRDHYFYANPTDYFVPRLPPMHQICSDISLNLPVLEYFSKQCQTAAEFGVRDGHSTVAILSGLAQGPAKAEAKLISFDIEQTPIVNKLRRHSPCQWEFLLRSSIQGPPIPEVDLLFIDTMHTYTHVKAELALHGRQARRYISFHDTTTCGEFDLSGPNPRERGIAPAIKEFLEQYPGEYRVAYESDCSNGMIIMERICLT